jgi:uncharacterized cupin superfamily protein
MDQPPNPPALDPDAVAPRVGSIYPAPFNRLVEGREKRVLGDVLGLTQFGVNLTTLAPGAASAMRHWHRNEDEFIYVLEGELTLVTDDGEQLLVPGTAAGFAAGKPDGHQLVNRSGRVARYLEIGTRAGEDDYTYPDDDIYGEKRADGVRFFTKDGKPY